MLATAATYSAFRCHKFFLLNVRDACGAEKCRTRSHPVSRTASKLPRANSVVSLINTFLRCVCVHASASACVCVCWFVRLQNTGAYPALLLCGCAHVHDIVYAMTPGLQAGPRHYVRFCEVLSSAGGRLQSHTQYSRQVATNGSWIGANKSEMPLKCVLINMHHTHKSLLLLLFSPRRENAIKNRIKRGQRCVVRWGHTSTKADVRATRDETSYFEVDNVRVIVHEQ